MTEAVTPPETRPLAGLRVLVLTSGHEALDARVYGREAKSLEALGATVTIVGKLTRGTPDSVEVLPIRPASHRLSRFLVQPWHCVWRARRQRPHIVHFHDAEMLAVLPVARLIWPRAKFVYDVHEDFPNLILIRDWLPKSLRAPARALTAFCEAVLARLAHGIVAVTPPLASRFPHRNKVAALNFPTAEFFEQAREAARPPAERGYELVHLGTLSQRRAEFLADVIDELNRRRPGTRSVVVGAPAAIIEFLRSRALPNCDLRASVAHAEVAGILAEAKVGIDVHPWDQPHLRPALAVKLGEYMACGCAVVASAMPVLDELLSRAASPLRGIVTIEGGSPGDYAGAVIQCLSAIEGGDDFGADLRRFALAHFNWETEASRIGDLYRTLVGGRP